jgi:hypothetical protein
MIREPLTATIVPSADDDAADLEAVGPVGDDGDSPDLSLVGPTDDCFNHNSEDL